MQMKKATMASSGGYGRLLVQEGDMKVDSRLRIQMQEMGPADWGWKKHESR
jgi:hypothetical protein